MKKLNYEQVGLKFAEKIKENDVLGRPKTVDVAMMEAIVDSINESMEAENKQKHPIQPLYEDEHGVIRFKPNKIVQYLLDNGGIDMNKIGFQQFDQAEEEHFAQLIGYSLSGFGELSYVSDEAYNEASEKAEKLK